MRRGFKSWAEGRHINQKQPYCNSLLAEGFVMATNRASWQGYVFLGIGVFFLVVTFVLYAVDVVKSNRLLMYIGVSVLLVVLGIVYVVLSKRIPQRNIVKKPRRRA